MGTPCEAFSRARTGPPEPRPLQDAFPPARPPEGPAHARGARAGPPRRLLRPPEPPARVPAPWPRGRVRHREPRALLPSGHWLSPELLA
eukprot:6969358-Alexandrium_andersonii.AAC.1